MSPSLRDSQTSFLHGPRGPQFCNEERSSLRACHPRRSRKNPRSKHSKFSSKARCWALMESCYVSQGGVPSSQERFLLKLAETTADVEEGKTLEGWTVQQMLLQASGDSFVGPDVVVHAIKDVRSRLGRSNPMTVSVRISNVTSWRPEVANWITAGKDHVVLVQETHLRSMQQHDAQSKMHRAGYQLYGGVAHPTDKSTKGGVAVLVASHVQGRFEHSHLEEGCGFEAVDVRLQHTNLLVVSLYLQTGTSLHSRPNSRIMGELIQLVKTWKGMWIIGGDFNLPPEEIAATNILAEIEGRICAPGEPTTDSGRQIDYAIVHKALEPLCRLELDWTAPHRPHASVRLRINMGEGLCPSMTLEQHSALQSMDPGDFKMSQDKVHSQPWLEGSLPRDEATQTFARLSEACKPGPGLQ